jgi:hypothetical protein
MWLIWFCWALLGCRTVVGGGLAGFDGFDRSQHLGG